MRVSKYDIDITAGGIETFGEPALDGFWGYHRYQTKESSHQGGAASWHEWLWKDTESRRTICFGFRAWGCWIYIQKLK